MRRSAAVVAACAAAFLVAPATAAAATTVSLAEEAGGVARLAIRGDAGPNRIGYARDLRGVTVRDLAGVVPGPGCVTVEGEAGTAARCGTAAQVFVGGLVDGGAGDDLIALAGLFDGPSIADGGPGDDLVEADGTLLGGPGADIVRGGLSGDLLDGGPGPDKIDGGGQRAAAETGAGPASELADRDFVDYRARTAAISVDLASGEAVDAGEAGEGDRLSNVEAVLGGAGDDVLIGSPGDDVLDGGAGTDRLSGGPGADRLQDGQGGAVLDGGEGDDRLQTLSANRILPPEAAPPQPAEANPGAGVLRGGPGRDTLESGRGVDRLDPGPDADDVVAGRRDRVDLRDDGFDLLVCTGGARVRADGPDLAVDCRRLRRAAPTRPWLVSAGGRRLLRLAGRVGRVVIACADTRRVCRGTLRVEVGGRIVGERRFAARPEAIKPHEVQLAPSVAREVRRAGSVRATFTMFGRDAEGRPVRQRRTARLCAGPCDDG